MSDMPERIWAWETKREVTNGYACERHWHTFHTEGVPSQITTTKYIRADLYDQLRKEVTSLAQESVKREKTLARLEAEVLSLRNTETAWLIEVHAKDTPAQWVRLDTGDAPYLYGLTPDANKAIRFARRQDAELSMKAFSHLWTDILVHGEKMTVFASEHAWMPAHEVNK